MAGPIRNDHTTSTQHPTSDSGVRGKRSETGKTGKINKLAQQLVRGFKVMGNAAIRVITLNSVKMAFGNPHTREANKRRSAATADMVSGVRRSLRREDTGFIDLTNGLNTTWLSDGYDDVDLDKMQEHAQELDDALAQPAKKQIKYERLPPDRQHIDSYVDKLRSNQRIQIDEAVGRTSNTKSELKAMGQKWGNVEALPSYKNMNASDAAKHVKGLPQDIVVRLKDSRDGYVVTFFSQQTKKVHHLPILGSPEDLAALLEDHIKA